MDNDAGIAVVLTVDVQPDTTLLLSALRSGFADVWQLPMSDADLATRASAVLLRANRRRARVDEQLTRFQRELAIDQRAGRHVQMGMLPPNPMVIDPYRLEHRVVPSLLLSGDFVDYFRVTDRYFAVYVADVSGHGASSAFVTVLLKNFSRRMRREYRQSMLREPGEMVEWINRELLEQQIDKHVAMFFALIDLQAHRLMYVNAGHFPPAMIVRAAASDVAGDAVSSTNSAQERSVETLEQFGKPVGLFADASYQATAVPLLPNDRVVVFSDGVLEVVEGEGLQQRERALRLAAAQSTNVEEIWEALNLDVEQFGPDDASCLVITREL